MLRLANLTVEAGAFSLRDISLEVPHGGYAILMGATGSGKTTLLEAICGLRRVTQGRIELDGRAVGTLPARGRGIGYVPQDLALFTTMSVAENLGFALHIRHVTTADEQARVRELADLLGIGHLLERMPHALSGGEKQRVALGRALAAQPRVLLLDEPFSALDDQMREDMYALMRTVRQATGATVLHVTHSRSEAQALGDRRFVLDRGRIVEHTHPHPSTTTTT
jgi:molybdate/tungstate transport system ATP-binding protein